MRCLSRRRAGQYSDDGRPGTTLRMLVGLKNLTHALNMAEEETVRRRMEALFHQYFKFLVNLRGVISSPSVTVCSLVPTD